MDKRNSEERFKALGFVPQKENVYNKLLPYAEKLDEESTKLFLDIKTNLIKSVLAREMRPGCALWTSRLNKYMKIYGLKFSKEDHVGLIKLFFNLLTLPNLEPTRINKFAATLIFLIKKRDLLSQDDLQLEWKPLYHLCVRVMEKSKTDIGMYRYYSTLENTFENLIRYARVYFPVSATQEILEQFRPRLCPYSNTDITNAVEYLELFLPIVVKPQDADIGYKLWFEEFMNLWEICHNANFWENHMAWLMARLASYTIGHIDWEPYIPIMFVRFLRSLHLPVGYRQKQSYKLFKIDVSAMTLWIVCTLGGEKQTAFFHLEKFMQTLESYFYPANTGRWTPKIREFLRKISFYFVQRVHCERFKNPTWDYYTSDSHKLTDDDIDRFINIMTPCVEHAMFSKQGSQEIIMTLNYLASLRPNIIIPMALDKLYSSMDSLTEPHKLTSSMMCVMAVSRYMVQGKQNNYPEGPTHVIPLLMTLLPGIDPNDTRKCFTTFNFIIHFCTLAPLVNCSEANKYYDDLTEEEHIVCEASAGFEDFVIQFFDRLCTWVESNSLEFTRMELSDNHDFKSKADSMAENALIHVISAVLIQCSPDIFISALKKMYNFVTSRIMELNVSGNMLATICHAFAKINPKETLKLFIPHLCNTIERLLNEHEDVMNEEHLNGELLYNMLLLSEVVDAHNELINYMDQLMRILDLTLHMKSTEGSQTSAHLLNAIVSTLSFTQPVEYRSINRPLDGHIKDFLPIRYWGCPGNLNNLNIKWYSPGKAEIDCIQSIFDKYLVPELEKLEKYSSGELDLSREDVNKTLKIIIAILGAQSVLPLWEEPALQLVDSSIEPWAFELIVGSPYTVTMPDGRNIRKVIADTVYKVQKRIQEINEGDTTSLKSIIHIYDILLFNKFRGRDFEMHWKSFHIAKRTLEDRLHQKKKHLRHILIDRVMLHQEFRNESRSCSFTETHKQILLALFELGVSRYSVVRSSAQSKIFTAVSTFSYSYTVLTPYIKEILQIDSSKFHEKFKGCLHILLGPKNSPIITRHDWKFIGDIWPMLVKSMPSEKPSIVNLMSALNEAINKCFPTIAIALEINEESLKPAYFLIDNVPKVDLSDFRVHIENSVEKLKAVSNQKYVDYNQIISLLLEAALNGNLHWRYHTMTISLLQYLVHPDVKYNPAVVRFFLHSLLNEAIAIRKIALKVVVFILIQNKPKFKKVAIDPYKFSKTTDKKIVPGIRSDNQWLLYNSKTIPKNTREWDEARYVHDQYSGFYTWPSELKVYAPSYDQPLFTKRQQGRSDQEIAIYNFFKNSSNTDMLIKYWSMEEKKGKDQFNLHRFSLIKNLFKILDDELLDLFIPHLERLVSGTEEHNQRCAAELISGIIRGSKHWNFEKTEKLWTVLIPILRTAFNNLTNETILDWSLCIAMSFESRDPNRMYWLLEFLMDNPLSEPTSFIGCARIYMLQNALNQQPWRNSELINRLLEYFQNYLSHPFQNVREKISTCLVSVFCKDIVFPNGNVTNCPRVGDFFAQIKPSLDVLYETTLMNLNHSSKDTNNINLATNHLKAVSLNDSQKEEHLRLFKTVAKYVTGSVARMNYSAVKEHYDLLPLACVLQSNDVDDELNGICSNLLAILGCTIILDRYLPAALEAAKIVSVCPFWSARAVIAEFIPVLVFHNMATFFTNPEWVLEVQRLVLVLLEDVQPEVRVQAGKVLSGLLHCKFLPSPDDLLKLFKQKAKTKLQRSHGKKSQNIQNGALKIRHGGVLGLCAFINSHPYDVSDFLPDIFSELGPHLNDPQPIPATIRKTLGDFKRTHHDNWEVHKLKFTEDELSVLSDLTVPPSYYA